MFHMHNMVAEKATLQWLSA